MSDQPLWTADQVASANAYQKSGVFHPYTCGDAACRAELVAHPDGWHCPQCDYRQQGAPCWMLDWSWRKCDWRVARTGQLDFGEGRGEG